MTRKIVSMVLAACLLFAGFTSQVAAAVIGTQQAMSIEQRQGNIDHIQAQLQRSDVQQAMIDLGVDPEQAALRVSSLNDQELAQLQQEIDTLPAGGDGILALIGAVFVVLLILELTGVINIFNKT